MTIISTRSIIMGRCSFIICSLFKSFVYIAETGWYICFCVSSLLDFERGYSLAADFALTTKTILNTRGTNVVTLHQ